MGTFDSSLLSLGKIIWATISRVANRWFVSITVETPTFNHLRPAENQGAVGVDMSIVFHAP